MMYNNKKEGNIRYRVKDLVYDLETIQYLKDPRINKQAAAREVGAVTGSLAAADPEVDIEEPRCESGWACCRCMPTFKLRPLRRKCIYRHRKALSAPGRRPCRAWGSHPVAPPIMNFILIGQNVPS